MPAARKTLVHDQGTTFNLNIVFKDSNKNPVDLTGHAVTFTVYGKDRQGPYRASVSNAIVDALGNITIKVTDEEASKWGSGRLSYEVDHHSPNGDVQRLFYGPLDVKGVE